MAGETDKLLDHSYDGIKEYDNPLPRWWVWLFYGTILFSAVYFPYYVLGFGPSTGEMYEAEVAQAARTAPKAPAASGGTTPGAPAGASSAAASLEGNPGAIAAGKVIYRTNCLPCHGDKGQGLIGPNLTDNYWLHGNGYADILHVVSNGVPDKGMVAWKAILNPTKIGQVGAYVLTLQGANPPNAKAPQGKKYPE